MSPAALSYLHSPSSVAVIGASDDPDKIGGRPIAFMQRFGFKGTILPVNPSRATVQGLPAYPDVASLPMVPDVALIAVPGEAAIQAVHACTERGVQGAVIMASGFGETGRPEDLERQQRMVSEARSAGMRIVGPNSQGLANFGTGTILSFSTMFVEQEPMDGPIGIVSQSGAMCSIPYGLLRRRGLGVRYVHGTGNDADLGVGDIAEAVLDDPDIRLLLLYLEDIRDPGALERTAQKALEREIPVVAMMGGRSADGRRAAASHTGALANEQRVVDAFFKRTGIWRARTMSGLVDTAHLYLQDWRPRGRRLAIVSNSGAICVLGADAAADADLSVTTFEPATTDALTEVLPAFATKTNPIDITAALLTDSSLFGKVLPLLAADRSVDACFIGVPVAGKGYDVPRFATDAAAFAQRDNMPVVVAAPQEVVASAFRDAGLVVFDDEASAIAALGQYLHHHELMDATRRLGPLQTRRGMPANDAAVLSEAAGLAFLQAHGIATVGAIVCGDPQAAAEAFRSLGGQPVAVKGCPTGATHKSELGLVRLKVASAADVEAAATDMIATMSRLGIEHEGVLVAPMIAGVTEGLVGAHVDPVFGPVILVGAGGKYVEALDDVEVLVPPFDAETAEAAIRRLRIAPLLAGVRGEPATDVAAWAQAAVALGSMMLADPSVLSVDVNPLMVGAAVGEPAFGAIAVDAVVVRR
ncbi:MAG: acetate--CoA ligase family protein [Actinomycetota bacterium]|nr:acetate--CoA ligase family protein [Actinomycetota bacterium]